MQKTRGIFFVWLTERRTISSKKKKKKEKTGSVIKNEKIHLEKGIERKTRTSSLSTIVEHERDT